MSIEVQQQLVLIGSLSILNNKSGYFESCSIYTCFQSGYFIASASLKLFFGI